MGNTRGVHEDIRRAFGPAQHETGEVIANKGQKIDRLVKYYSTQSKHCHSVLAVIECLRMMDELDIELTEEGLR